MLLLGLTEPVDSNSPRAAKWRFSFAANLLANNIARFRSEPGDPRLADSVNNRELKMGSGNAQRGSPGA